MKLIISFIFCICTSILYYGQNQNTKWYFGGNAALDFVTNPPTILNTNVMSAPEGCSSVADTTGNLLFYTNGVTVWNSQHTVIANGTGLFGNISTAQSALIIKQPNSTNLYYIFTMGLSSFSLTTGLNYSVVDMNLAAGMGSVTVKNSPLYNFHCSEQLHASKRANGIDYWIMIHEGNNTSNYRAYLLTAGGINTVAVVSSIGTSYFGNGFLFGHLKFSHSGQKLASVLNNGLTKIIEISDFDNNTGLVSNPLILNSQTGAYSCEFSPDDSKFYSGGWGAPIIQWDLSLASPTTILSSSVVIDSHTTTAWGDPYSFAGMQVGPNGKIYVAVMGPQYLGVINSPYVAGIGCNWIYNGQSVAAVVNGSNSISVSGLPNMVKSPSMVTTTCVTRIVSNPQSICANNFYSINGHTYTTAGSYVDVLQTVTGCDSIVVTQLTVNPFFTTNNPQNICLGTSYTFNGHNYTNTGTYSDTLASILNCDSVIITQLTVSECLRLIGLEDEYSDLRLYPNPTETDLTVTFGSQVDIGKVSIVNSLGQTIREEDLQIQKTEFILSTSDLDKGIYLIQFKTSAGTVTKTFVKN